jgi:hypothetical protein
MKLDFDSVVSGVRVLLGEGYIERAEELQRKVSGFDGAAAIVEAIERYS